MDIKGYSSPAEVEDVIRAGFASGRPSFMMMLSAPFANSAGIMAGYRLARDIMCIYGYAVYGILWEEWEKINERFVLGSAFREMNGVIFIPKDFARTMCEKYNCIAVYTDHDAENPLGAKTLARWLGYRPGKLGAIEFHGKSENIFCYNECFGHYQTDPKPVGNLSIYPDVAELHSIFYFDKNAIKDKVSVYTGKKKYIAGYVDRYDFFITREYPNSRTDLAEMLRRTRILYTFDSCTALTYEAMMCGCFVVVIDVDGVYTHEEICGSEIGNGGLYMYGDDIDFSIRPEEIEKRVLSRISEINISYATEHLPNFIRIMNKKYKESL